MDGYDISGTLMNGDVPSRVVIPIQFDRYVPQIFGGGAIMWVIPII